MNLKVYAVVLDLVRRLSPFLPVLRSRSSSLGDQFERALIRPIRAARIGKLAISRPQLRRVRHLHVSKRRTLSVGSIRFRRS